MSAPTPSFVSQQVRGTLPFIPLKPFAPSSTIDCALRDNYYDTVTLVDSHQYDEEALKLVDVEVNAKRTSSSASSLQTTFSLVTPRQLSAGIIAYNTMGTANTIAISQLDTSCHKVVFGCVKSKEGMEALKLVFAATRIHVTLSDHTAKEEILRILHQLQTRCKTRFGEL